MSNIAKLIIPCIDNTLSLEDFSDDAGFVDCYTEDINRPYLDYHIFLMYKWGKIKSTKVFYKIKKIPSFYGYKIIYINGESYIIYTFTSNCLINRLKSGLTILGDINKARILRFWSFKDSWVTSNVMRGTITCGPLPNIVPEEDYLEDE